VPGDTDLAQMRERERCIGDIVVVCTGGDPGEVRLVNLVLLVNATITSDLTDSNRDETEALLLIDDPLPGVTNVSNGVSYDGQVEGKPGVLPGTPGGPGDPVPDGAPDSGNVYTGTRIPGNTNRIEWNGIPFRPAPAGEAATETSVR